MTIADIIQIIIGILSLIATVGVSFAIYWLQSRHEKEMEDLAKENSEKLLREEADKFLIDNESERDYLPLCVFASNLHRHEKHTRKIYTNFCRCRSELQNKILEVAEFKCRTIDGVDWLDKAIDKFKDDIQKFHLGRDYLYDGAKYFHRGFKRYRGEKWDYSYRRLFKPLVKNRILKELTGTDLISISSYVEDYFYFCIEKHDTDKIQGNPMPPIDYLWESQNLASIEESKVCGWMMEIVNAITIIIHNKITNKDGGLYFEDMTDEQPETFEDKYYETVRALYYTYCL